MGLFKSRTEKELDALMNQINSNMANNYKDAAQQDLQEYKKALTLAIQEEKLSEKRRLYYTKQLSTYQERMKGYTHKDQKPHW